MLLFFIFYSSRPIIPSIIPQPAKPKPEPVLPGFAITEGLDKINTELFEDIVETDKNLVVIPVIVQVKCIGPGNKVEIQFFKAGNFIGQEAA